jgi:hypothetical protein
LLEAELLFSEGKERKELFSEICMLLILQVWRGIKDRRGVEVHRLGMVTQLLCTITQRYNLYVYWIDDYFRRKQWSGLLQWLIHIGLGSDGLVQAGTLRAGASGEVRTCGYSGGKQPDYSGRVQVRWGGIGQQWL